MMESVYLLVALGAIVAGFVQGLSGFAFGMVAMSFWAWGLEPRLAAALSVFGALVGQLVAVFTVRRGFNLRLLLPFVLLPPLFKPPACFPMFFLLHHFEACLLRGLEHVNSEAHHPWQQLLCCHRL